MLNSKAIKSLPRLVSMRLATEPSTLIGKITQKVVHAFKEYVYWPVDSFFSRNYERASRSLAFAIHGWMHYDFDSAYIYDIMAFKMKRLYKCLENGHAIQQSEDMKALKEAIKLCERLFGEDYERKYHNAHDKKWGNVRSKTIPEYDDNGKIKHYRWERSRPKVKTDAQKTKERAEFLECWKNGEKDRLADQDKLNEIFKKHQRSWWD